MAFWPSVVMADGLMVPQPNTSVYETGQEAVIYYENGHEEMMVSSSFRGDAEEFAWIVPTPNIPEVTRGSWEMFVGLRQITTVAQNDYTISGFGDSAFSTADYISEPAVVEIERTSVGYYDIAVLEARTTEGLQDWFTDNGFYYPVEGEYILDEYIDAGWYFTAVKLNTSELSSATSSDVTKGDSLPLHFSFDADKMVFPLQLSQVARLYNDTTTTSKTKLKNNVDITLYLIAPERRSLPGFTQRYSGFISGQAVNDLSYGTDGESLMSANVEEQYVLTRLSRSFPVSEMTYDLYPREEDNTGLLNDRVRSDARTVRIWWLAGAAIVVTILLLGALMMMARDSKTITKND
ncbi:MAG: hypothetical protein CO132_02375 [Candidatus Kerfeldbacteria bacterium CG_4_9_14_3_um_filter_45_8]|nr:MAG: hypothetical protein CO132_02375 [Candidatus Kerfeldbacteria bacterium CG_4_9_14_3_um_filter_45_8]